MTRSLATAAAGVLLATGQACTYQIQGKVLPGAVSTVQVVSMDSQAWFAALRDPGLGGVEVQAIVDPDRPNRRGAQGGRTDPDGGFAIPISDFGAGVLEYDVLVTARMPGHSPATSTLRLPSSESRFIVYLATGTDRAIGRPTFDPEGEIERFWR
ncbi:MAG: hypothetical protein AAGI30_11965 [Planctomycetota bacterium]